jgi:ATP/maltotriose-dependent transcriptional regulator MalT
MGAPLANQVTRKIDLAAELYHRLLMVVAPAGMGKTSALHDVHERSGAPLINVNL